MRPENVIAFMILIWYEKLYSFHVAARFTGSRSQLLEDNMRCAIHHIGRIAIRLICAAVSSFYTFFVSARCLLGFEYTMKNYCRRMRALSTYRFRQNTRTFATLKIWFILCVSESWNLAVQFNARAIPIDRQLIKSLMNSLNRSHVVISFTVDGWRTHHSILEFAFWIIII